MVEINLIPHKFEQNDWTVNKTDLHSAILQYSRDTVIPSYGWTGMLEQFFEVMTWSEGDIEHFLCLHFDKVKGLTMDRHVRHVRTVVNKMHRGVF